MSSCCTSNKEPKLIHPRNPYLTKNAKPISPDNALSAIEQVFFKSKPDRPQVIMGFMLKLSFPDNLQKFTLNRLIQILQLSASEHHRLSCFVDPDNMTTSALAEKAADLPLLINIHPNLDMNETWKTVYTRDINTNFETKTGKPLWRTSILLPPQVFLHEIDQYVSDESEKEYLAKKCLEAIETSDDDQKPQISMKSSRTIDLIWTLHHSLGDALSIFTFMRTFFKYCVADNFNIADLGLNQVSVNTKPPPLLDNLIDPSFIEVMPVAFGMMVNHLFKKKGRRFRASSLSDVAEDVQLDGNEQIAETAHQSEQPNPDVPQLQPLSKHEIAVSIAKPMKPSFNSQTDCHFIRFDADIVASLRKRCKQEGTTVAAAIVVSALAAVRVSFARHEKYKTHPLPKHQGWVVTNSMRHLLPNSQLLNGADKETDPSINVFGGYAGSVMNSSLKIVDSHHYWERCRLVRRDIAFVHRASIRRMRLMNYCYRHPRVWNLLQKNTDLAKLSRTYSVEVANVGAWKSPAAPFDADSTDPRFRLENFAGTLNSSFDGVRGLFMLAVCTVGGEMSIGIAYDSKAVRKEDAQVFTLSLQQGLTRVAESQNRSISIIEAGSI